MGGPVRWFIDNPIAANLLMVFLIVGGLLGVPALEHLSRPSRMGERSSSGGVDSLLSECNWGNKGEPGATSSSMTAAVTCFRSRMIAGVLSSAADPCSCRSFLS